MDEYNIPLGNNRFVLRISKFVLSTFLHFFSHPSNCFRILRWEFINDPKICDVWHTEENFYLYLSFSLCIFGFIRSCWFYRGRIYYSEMYDMLKNMDPPLGFGSKCPDRLAFKKLIRYRFQIFSQISILPN